MSWKLKKIFTAAAYGTSLTTGRLSTFYTEELQRELEACPEARGPVMLYNMGKGSQNSDWGLANAPFVANLNPVFILSEGFGINSSAINSGIPQVELAQHLTNIQAMHNIWKARNPNVDIQWQTMNPVSYVGSINRPNLQQYYEAEMALAVSMGDRTLNNYPRWPNPMPDVLTQDGDGLHPTKFGTDMFLKPYVKLAYRQAMARHWGLTEPTV